MRSIVSKNIGEEFTGTVYHTVELTNEDIGELFRHGVIEMPLHAEDGEVFQLFQIRLMGDFTHNKKRRTNHGTI